MLSKEEIKKWLLENCVSQSGKLDLSGLDFSDFDGTVDISGMKVKKNLLQNKQEVEGCLYQSDQRVRLDLEQCCQRAGRDLDQHGQDVGGDLMQNSNDVFGNLYQDDQNVAGNLYQDGPKAKAAVDQADAPRPSILEVIDSFANRESTTGFTEDYKKYAK